MENKISHDFDSLAQRILYSYVGTFPNFKPIQSEVATENSQKQFHRFMKDIAEKSYDNPEILNLPIQPDDYYGDWQLQNRKPELIENMRKHIKKIADFYLLLLKIGEIAVLHDNKLCVNKNDKKFASKTLARLANFGLRSENRKEEVAFWSDTYPDMLQAWKLLATISIGNDKNPLLIFSRCMFDPNYSYASDIFRNLVADKSAYQMLENFFKQNDYKRIDIREDEISQDWVKSYSKKEEPLKASWAEKSHGGISITYNYRKRNQIVFGLRVPRFKELLAYFDEMDDQLKEFVIDKTKKCDGCGYCTQTDKTGTRKPQYMSVNHNGTYNLCQLFPGFTYVWTDINDKVASGMIKMLAFIDMKFGEENNAS